MVIKNQIWKSERVFVPRETLKNLRRGFASRGQKRSKYKCSRENYKWT